MVQDHALGPRVLLNLCTLNFIYFELDKISIDSQVNAGSHVNNRGLLQGRRHGGGGLPLIIFKKLKNGKEEKVGKSRKYEKKDNKLKRIRPNQNDLNVVFQIGQN